MKTSEKYEEENTEVTLKLTSAASSLPLIFINILRQAHNIVTIFVRRNSILAILRGMMFWFWWNLASRICNSLFQHIVYIRIHGKVKSAWSLSDSWLDIWEPGGQDAKTQVLMAGTPSSFSLLPPIPLIVHATQTTIFPRIIAVPRLIIIVSLKWKYLK